MNKIFFSLFLILCFFCSTSFAFDLSWCQQKTFVVTAYYSPKTWQAFYYKSSFEDEKILNWEWYCGTSWKEVFNWMLAWPSSYLFGTLIYFPGRWRWEIADRWGAIVSSWEKWQQFDRIDIRMWNWTEWLIRALTFGKKILSWFICSTWLISQKEIWINFDMVPIFKNFFDISIRIQQLTPWNDGIRTRTLQKYLIKLGYLNSKYHNGIYDNYTSKALCNYQIKNKIVSKKNPDCWKFWKLTRNFMKQDVTKKNLLPNNLRQTSSFGDIIIQAETYNSNNTLNNNLSLNSNNISTWTNLLSWKISQPKIEIKKNIFLFYKSYKKWEQNSEIKILQKFLQGQWLFSWIIDWIYSKKTIDSVADFQEKHWLLKWNDLKLKWYLWPQTREKINEIRKK
jgi:hypothetical protein